MNGRPRGGVAPIATGLAAGLLAVLVGIASDSKAADAVMRFVRDGESVNAIGAAELRGRCGVERIEVDDPYYEQRKAFWAHPLACVLRVGFGRPLDPKSDRNFFLRALDGYTKPAPEAKLAEPGGWLAISDADLGTQTEPRFAPIDRRQVDPAPFYLIWTQPHQNDLHHYPWPYQLATIEIAAFESEYPHTLPAGTPAGSPAQRGFAIFRVECIACHAVNGEGGLIGPDLNIPRSIVEYRPAEQIKAFVRDPQSFRYTTMPPHPHLSDEQLDALVSYFEAMRDRKHDPRRPAH